MQTAIDDAFVARCFRALSHPRRARIFRILIENPRNGDSYSTLQNAAKMPSTSLVHHLREMERCGVVRRARKGSVVQYILTPAEIGSALKTTTGALEIRVTRMKRAA
jgi:DNA-binding transcriptional ArsR family regulator